MENNIDQARSAESEKKVKNFFKKIWEPAWEIFKIVVIASVIVLPIRYFLFQPFIVKGESMTPTFQPGDYLIVDEISYRFSQPKRGDVIVFNYPKDTTQRFIKRVIGLPGEIVEVKEGKVTVSTDNANFTELNEKYLPSDLKTFGDIKVALGSSDYFVLGDNRSYSFDSRGWGLLPKNDIIGRVFLRLFPLAGLSDFPSPSYQ